MNDNEFMSVVYDAITKDRILLLRVLLKEIERTCNDSVTEIKKLIENLIVKETSDLGRFSKNKLSEKLQGVDFNEI